MQVDPAWDRILRTEAPKGWRLSKLIEKLEKIGQRVPSPMGFGAAAKQGASPKSILLMGVVTSGRLPRLSKPRKELLDAVLVNLGSGDESALAGRADSLEGLIWGASAPRFDRERIERLKDQGCDFIVFDPTGAPAALLNEDDVGKIVRVGRDLPESAAAAIHDLPIDGALLASAGLRLPLSVQDLIDIEGVRGMLGKPFLMDAPAGMTPPDLEAVRDAGTAALVVDALSKQTGELADRVHNLRPKRHRPGRRGDLTPSVPMSPAPAFPQDEDDDDEEDF